MIGQGILYAILSGIANGLFTTPMKLIPRWKWENIWLIFILTACLVMPAAMVGVTAGSPRAVFDAAPENALRAALVFGFLWGFGAILFGLSVDRLGVSLANSLVIGISSALGSLTPLLLGGALRIELRQILLFAGVAAFLGGVMLCGSAGRMRESGTASSGVSSAGVSSTGLLFASGAGTLSAIFNIGYSLALPIAAAGEQQGLSAFAATNCIWLLMLAAGSIPNVAFCLYLMRKHESGGLLLSGSPGRGFSLSVLMGLLWGGSIFLYGAATPLLGDIGPSIGWPLSLAVALLLANGMGVLLGEWRSASAAARRRMMAGIGVLLIAVVLCAASAGSGKQS
jgi:L-rhamnose-H+ transport protein